MTTKVAKGKGSKKVNEKIIEKLQEEGCIDYTQQSECCKAPCVVKDEDAMCLSCNKLLE